MSAPYWGRLPGSNAVGRSNRLSDDYGSPTDQQPSIDQPRRRSNRISVQTTNTEAATESTLSPYASPSASSFPPQGLAPRPPSLPYSPADFPPDVADKRYRRQSQPRDDVGDDDDDEEGEQGLPLPAAPDVPRAPPVSYRHPFVNGGSQLYPAPVLARAPKQSDSRPKAIDMEEEYHQNSRRPQKGQEYGAEERGQKSQGTASGNRDRVTGEIPVQTVRKGSAKEVDPRREGHREVSGQPRKASASSQSGRRKFADDRSPLQRLELTLDSITKEEKRARVEAAEQRVREKALLSDRSPGQQVRFREKGMPAKKVEEERRGTEPTISAHRGPLSQNPPETGVRYKTGSSGTPAGPSPGRVGGNKGTPQRNLSFRERAARNDLNLPNGMESSSPTSPPENTSGSRIVRSGSNKLRKEPPSDMWYHRRLEPEPVGVNVAAPTLQADASRGTTMARTEMIPQRDKALPSVPTGDGRRVDMATEDLVGTTGPGEFGGVRRRATEPIRGKPVDAGHDFESRREHHDSTADADIARRNLKLRKYGSDDGSSDSEHHHIMSRMLFRKGGLKPGDGMYTPPQFLDEWKKGTVGTLGGTLLDLSSDDGKDSTWWEGKSRRRSGISSRPRRAEAFDGEYDETNAAPTRFRPQLYLKCGPLLRYCGIRKERIPTRHATRSAISDREIWRGTVMIVTQDEGSAYEIAPTLRLFIQPIDLLPPPPAQISDEHGLPPEYVDPIAGHPKLGRRGETLYVRPVEHLEEAKDLSRDETDEGLFESKRSPPDLPGDGSSDLPGSYASRRKRVGADGETAGKYKEVRGFRLHAERGCTFWRFNIEVELQEKQQRIAYRINRGPSMGFWVPARGRSMNIMFYSCNGFSMSVKTDELSGPDPMWRDVLNTHQTQPFHVMIGGGDQIYNDVVMEECKIFHAWSRIKNPLHKHNAAFTTELQDELETFYLERYCMWFSQGLYGLANSQIPMVNMFDDHDLIDGFGSYPHHDMNSPVFCGLGAVAFKYYMLFQHQSIMDETEMSEPSWITGVRPGPFINELSRSILVDLGADVSLLAVDARTERTEYNVISRETWEKIINRCFKDVKTGGTKHLLVLLGVPIAYPRLVWLENILTSRLMDPFKALSKTGMFGNVLNHIDGGVEVLDDLNDHWTARNHKAEREDIIMHLQDLAAIKSVRVTILSGDVHLAAVGQFYSRTKYGLPKHKDFRYMPNVISSAIVNSPPPDLMADILNKRNKIHHLDKDTDESMIPMFPNGVDGKPRNNKHLLPHRNWCSIRQWTPGSTPPPTPPLSAYDRSPSPQHGRGGLLRRLSKTRRPSLQPGPPRGDVSRPPISGSGSGLFRTFSRRNSHDSSQPGKLTRSLSLPRTGFNPARWIGLSKPRQLEDDDQAEFANNTRVIEYDQPPPSRDRAYPGQEHPSHIHDDFDDDYPEPRRPTRNKAARLLGRDDLDDGGYQEARPVRSKAAKLLGRETNDDDDEYGYIPARSTGKEKVHLRGGGQDEYSDGDDSYFSARPSVRVAHHPLPVPGDTTKPPAHTHSHSRNPSHTLTQPSQSQSSFVPKPFHRTPTGLSVKQLKHADQLEVNLEGGLDICLNVEVNPRDPAGITVPYRLLVPKLFFDENDEKEEMAARTRELETSGGFKRLLSFKGRRKKESGVGSEEGGYEEEREDIRQHDRGGGPSLGGPSDDEYDEDEDERRVLAKGYEKRY